MHITINPIILPIFLVTNLIVGVHASRYIKIINEYALANKSLRIGWLISTLFATLFMSSTLA